MSHSIYFTLSRTLGRWGFEFGKGMRTHRVMDTLSQLQDLL
jgi:hypothetical protein